MAEFATLRRVLSRTALRIRVQRGLEGGAWAVCASATLGALLQVVGERTVTLAVVGVSLASAVLAAALPLARADLAERIDRRCALAGRTGAAVSLLALPRRTAFMDAAIRDAELHAAQVRPALVQPLRWPRAGVFALLCVAMLVVVARWPRAQVADLVPAPAAQPTLELLDDDELAALRADAPSAQDPALEQLRARYEALLRDVERGTHDPAALIAGALALERELDLPDGELEQRAARAELARALERALPAVAHALAEDPGAAAHALRTLAERLHQGVSAAERAALQAALEHARERARAAVEKSLLAQKDRDAREPGLLKRAQQSARSLDALQRPSEPRRALEKLQRELEDAAAALAQQRQERASEALQRGADALDDAARQQRRARSERELLHAVAQLRELLQRRALSKRDRAQRAPEGGAAQARGTTQAQSAHGQRTEHDERGANTREVMQRGGDQGSMARVVETSTTTVEREAQRDVSVPGGSAHETARSVGGPRANTQYEDSALHGVHGVGPTRSQVIAHAAATGFASAPYRKVYADYREHAESVLERDQVPPSARFYVQRYFELVRPRAERNP